MSETNLALTISRSDIGAFLGVAAKGWSGALNDLGRNAEFTRLARKALDAMDARRADEAAAEQPVSLLRCDGCFLVFDPSSVPGFGEQNPGCPVCGWSPDPDPMKPDAEEAETGAAPSPLPPALRQHLAELAGSRAGHAADRPRRKGKRRGAAV